MPKYKNEEVINKNQSEQYKDLIIADLTNELADAKQQIDDMSFIVADLQTKVGGKE